VNVTVVFRALLTIQERAVQTLWVLGATWKVWVKLEFNMEIQTRASMYQRGRAR
jgi:hypothetical protein